MYLYLAASEMQYCEFIAWSCENDAWVAFWDHKMLKYLSYETYSMERCMISCRKNEVPKPFESEAPCVWDRAIGFGVCPPGFQSLLIMSLFFSFGIVMGILCHCMLERFNSDFSRYHSESIALSVRRDFGRLNSIGAVESYDNVKVRVSTFFLIEWSWVCSDLSQNVANWMKSSR